MLVCLICFYLLNYKLLRILFVRGHPLYFFFFFFFNYFDGIFLYFREKFKRESGKNN